MSITRQKLAEVIDALADYVEDVELKKFAAEKSERTVRVDKIAQRYEQTTGESLPEPLRMKLSQVDPEILDHWMRTAQHTGEEPDSLGQPGEVHDKAQPRTVKEAASQAEDSFLSWIVS